MNLSKSYLTSSHHPLGNVYDFLDRVEFIADEIKTIRITRHDYRSLDGVYGTDSDDEQAVLLHDLVERIYEEFFDVLLPVVDLLGHMWTKGEKHRLASCMQSKLSYNDRQKSMKSKWEYLINLGQIDVDGRRSSHFRRR